MAIGLVAHYPFNGNANDESENGNNGTVYGAALIQDRSGNARGSYNFTTGQYIDINHSSNLNIIDSITISIWIYRELETIGWQSMICKGNSSGMNSPYALLLRNNKVSLLLNRSERLGTIDVYQLQMRFRFRNAL